MESAESMGSETIGKQSTWCHFVMSNPRESLVTEPNLKALAAIVLEHFLHDDLFDFAYSATTLGGICGGGGADDGACFIWKQILCKCFCALWHRPWKRGINCWGTIALPRVARKVERFSIKRRDETIRDVSRENSFLGNLSRHVLGYRSTGSPYTHFYSYK